MIVMMMMVIDDYAVKTRRLVNANRSCVSIQSNQKFWPGQGLVNPVKKFPHI